MKSNIKLFALPVVVLLSLFYISFLFSSEIKNLKKNIDNIYFGNFIPIDKLHIIYENYTNIIYSQDDKTKNKAIIVKNWNFYKNQYKTSQERKKVDIIDNQIKEAFKIDDKKHYLFIKKQIKYLIEHEIFSASIQRKKFLDDYKKVQNYLYYNQVIIVVFILLFTSYIIYITIKTHKKQQYLIEKYKHDSITDGLTKLYNRKYFDIIFNDAPIITKDNNWLTAFIMIDIDFFKQYNDTYGHDAGDIALKKVSKTLHRIFNDEYDYVFRLGGEEFGVLIFDTNIPKLKEKLAILKDNIKKLNIEHTAIKTKLLTLSMGIVIINEENSDMSSNELYKLADKKLYQSKENGRDQYTL